MNDVELLQGTVVALTKRLEKLERRLEADDLKNGDTAEALSVMRALNLDGDSMVNMLRVESRKKLVKELRMRGWAFERIARALHCTVQTVRRYEYGISQAKGNNEHE